MQFGPLEGAAAGLGMTLLPKIIADSDKRLLRVETSANRPIPDREIWLIAHTDLAGVARVASAMEWIRGIVSLIVRFTDRQLTSCMSRLF
jgi:DNA-binding transcriptional LysR family regulator